MTSSLKSQIAMDVLEHSIRKDVYGNVSSSGKFVNNPVPYSFTLYELRQKFLPVDPPEKSPFYQETMYDVSRIMTDQRLIVVDKVKSIIQNYHEITKPILLAKFEESPYFLVLNGNHRLSAALLLGQQYISAYLVDVRESFR